MRKNTLIFGILMVLCSVSVSCNKTEFGEIVLKESKFSLDDFYLDYEKEEEEGALCYDFWHPYTPSGEIPIDTLFNNLIDFYNIYSLLHSCISDLDMYSRFDDTQPCDFFKKYGNINPSFIIDPDVRNATKKFLTGLKALATLPADSAIYSFYELRETLLKSTENHRILDSNEIEKDYDCEMLQRCYIDEEMVTAMQDTLPEHFITYYKKANQAKTYDAKLFYLNECIRLDLKKKIYGCDSTFLTVFEKTMLKGIYSPLLYLSFFKWRCYRQINLSVSKDAPIPHGMYNKMREQVADVILLHLVKHPEDIFAIRSFIMLAYQPNIYRTIDRSAAYFNSSVQEAYWLGMNL